MRLVEVSLATVNRAGKIKPVKGVYKRLDAGFYWRSQFRKPLKSKDGKTALKWATKKGHTEIVKLLKIHGAKE